MRLAETRCLGKYLSTEGNSCVGMPLLFKFVLNRDPCRVEV